VPPTPRCTKSKSLSAITGMNIFIKHEWEQATGSFKERGGGLYKLNAADPCGSKPPGCSS
jgi:threonine dehydratase